MRDFGSAASVFELADTKAPIHQIGNVACKYLRGDVRARVQGLQYDRVEGVEITRIQPAEANTACPMGNVGDVATRGDRLHWLGGHHQHEQAGKAASCLRRCLSDSATT